MLRAIGRLSEFSKILYTCIHIVALNYELMRIFHLQLNIPIFYAKLLTETILFLFSYLAQKRFVFKVSPCFPQEGGINMKDNKKRKFRHEYKHYINMADYIAIKRRLSLVARPDRHAGPDGKYRIRSLYFETPDDKNLREKLYGVNNREKFRIRYYNDNTTFIKLEKKTKVNGLGNKLSAPLTKTECEKLIAGDIDWMRDSRYALVLELYAKMKYQQLRPKTIVDYIREPFIYEPGNVRVTIDTAIQTGIQSKDLFVKSADNSYQCRPSHYPEVKYDEFLPDVIRVAIQLKNKKRPLFPSML